MTLLSFLKCALFHELFNAYTSTVGVTVAQSKIRIEGGKLYFGGNEHSGVSKLFIEPALMCV
jgi:hypothetical protein